MITNPVDTDYYKADYIVNYVWYYELNQSYRSEPVSGSRGLREAESQLVGRNHYSGAVTVYVA
jgi:hypothetical protein